jgi:adenosine deaminase
LRKKRRIAQMSRTIAASTNIESTFTQTLLAMTTADTNLRPSPAQPTVLLHDHLDGGLRPATLLELCRERGIHVPAEDAAGLAAWVQANANSGSLERYLQGFGLTVAAMASVEACERVAFEAAEDARLDGCVLAEFRMAPLLLEPYGLSGEAVVEALVSGLRKSTLPSGLIVCAMRTDAPALTLKAAQLAAKYRDQGVIGFDLAGAELGFPPLPHLEAFKVARDAGLGITCHAGEADVGSRVLDAAAAGATRIGHGVHIMNAANVAEQQAWLDEARRLELHFEVCPTSNVHTGIAPKLAAHPLRAMLEAGLSVSVSTDNRLMSGVTLSGELAAVQRQCGIRATQITQMMREAARVSFLPPSVRTQALAAIDHWATANGSGN